MQAPPVTNSWQGSLLRLPSPNPGSRPKGIVVFSGGSAANNLVDIFTNISDNNACPLSYVIPISDNGGSSSELIRVFGGPGMSVVVLRCQDKCLQTVGIGDLRSTSLFYLTHASVYHASNNFPSACTALYSRKKEQKKTLRILALTLAKVD